MHGYSEIWVYTAVPVVNGSISIFRVRAFSSVAETNGLCWGYAHDPDSDWLGHKTIMMKGKNTSSHWATTTYSSILQMLAVALNSMLGWLTEMQALQAAAAACVFIYMLSYPWQGRLVSCKSTAWTIHGLTRFHLKLNHIPAVGSSSHLISFIGAVEFLFNARGIVQRGYDQVSIGISLVTSVQIHTKRQIKFDSIDILSLKFRTSLDGQ